MEAQSIDYANLVRRYTLHQYGVELVKTQVLKILYIIYGMYIARTDTPLFAGDRLKAWPYGPVFPRVYRLFKPQPGPIADDVLDFINGNRYAVSTIKDVIGKRYFWSAYQLSEWSHQVGGPWYDAVYPDDGDARWGAEITDESVKAYFSTFRL